ncbi:MAG: hypothetical protein VCD16_02355 [Planctomycetota bacterium]
MQPVNKSTRTRAPFLLHRVFGLVLGILLALSSSACTTAASLYRVRPLSKEFANSYKLDTSFYVKGTLVQDIFIATSKQVSDHAHREAAYQFDMMMKNLAPAIAQRIRDRKVLCILIGHKEFTSDLPQFGSDKKGEELDFYNWRSRGFLAWPKGRPTVVFAEEDVLEYEGGMRLESILIHEFGHVVHGAGFDKKLQDKLTRAFKNAAENGLWNDGRAAQRFRRVKSTEPVSLLDALVKSFPDQPPELIRRCLDGGDILVNDKPSHSKIKVTRDDKVLIVFGGAKKCYASRNRNEYWAEGFQTWYDTNRTMDHDHNHIHTREQFKEYDPVFAALCKEVMGESAWRFVSPRERAGKEHLRGFDQKKTPKVEQLEHIKKAANDYYDGYWKSFWKRLALKHLPPAGTG